MQATQNRINMKDYHAEISLTFSEVGEAETKEEAIQVIKNNFYEEYRSEERRVGKEYRKQWSTQQ